ncbi:MAG: TIR domain-containing protein [Candidatus Paceibacterota bacterium]
MRTHNLFISHSWAYGDAYGKLVSKLDKADRFSYRNYSVPKDSPIHNAETDRELLAAIKERMQFCDVVLILAGVYSTYSKWIKKEIQLANSGFANPKPIIAIQPWDSERTSQTVKDSAAKIVGWNTGPIVGAIRELNPYD